jgi:CRISPR type III-B/RAMP module RAMP protein Cmr6
MAFYPLMRGLHEWAEGGDQVAHAGLLLDRYVAFPSHDSFDQKAQSEQIDRVVRVGAPRNADANAILGRWKQLAEVLPHAETWEQRTVWRLAAHLSRASVLENGVCCLHPLYGFAYLPGSGLKGLARAQAILELGSEDHPEVCRIFGEPGHAGSVFFLEAWPKQWPRLEKDIVNSHHPEYYANRGVGRPPGDWENPNPTYFLAVAPGVIFRFCVAARDPWAANARADVQRAAGWLKAGLAELGAGAKTAAGYGYFEPCSGVGNQNAPAPAAAPQPAQGASTTPPQPVQGAAGNQNAPAASPAEEISMAIQQLESGDQARRGVPGLIERIQQLEDPAERQECARRLKKRLTDKPALKKVWNSDDWAEWKQKVNTLVQSQRP